MKINTLTIKYLVLTKKKMDEKKEKCLRESAINCGGFCKNLINNVSKYHTSGNYLGERIRSPS